MARPLKKGLDYFPHDTALNDSVELIVAEFGAVGYMVYFRLLEKIYSNEGYYCEWNDDVALLFAQRNGMGANVVSEIIAACLRRCLFDRGKFEQCSILTSKGIQERYFEATNRRSFKNLESDYLLINASFDEVFADNNSVNVCNNPIKECNNPQSKVKESKVNKIKRNNITSTDKRTEKSYYDWSQYSDVEKSSKYKTYDGINLSIAEATVLFNHINSADQFDMYLKKACRYKSENQFEMIIGWAIQDGNYIEKRER